MPITAVDFQCFRVQWDPTASALPEEARDCFPPGGAPLQLPVCCSSTDVLWHPIRGQRHLSVLWAMSSTPLLAMQKLPEQCGLAAMGISMRQSRRVCGYWSELIRTLLFSLPRICAQMTLMRFLRICRLKICSQVCSYLSQFWKMAQVLVWLGVYRFFKFIL